MKRRDFIKKSAIATGGIIMGGSVIGQLITNNMPIEKKMEHPTRIIKVHQGKGKNVLVLMGAGTRLGNTDRLTDSYIKGLVEHDHTVTKVYLGEMRLRGCRGCGACQHGRNGCAINDDMKDLYPLFEHCDVVALASPLYFWTLTSCVKAFIERLYAISENDTYPTKGMVLLMTAGDNHTDTFKQPLQYYHIISKVFGGNDLGHYCAGGCTGCEDIARHIDAKHLEGAYQLGLELK